LRTLQEIVKNGDLQSYMQGLGQAVAEIVPSRAADGNPDIRCHFVVIIAGDDDTPDVQFVSNARVPDLIKWLREAARKLERGKWEKRA
jgi:hypothetical protein